MLANKFENLAIKPRRAVWANIAEELQPGRRRKALIWYFSGAAAALALLLTGAFFFFSNPTHPTQNQFQANLPVAQDSSRESGRDSSASSNQKNQKETASKNTIQLVKRSSSAGHFKSSNPSIAENFVAENGTVKSKGSSSQKRPESIDVNPESNKSGKQLADHESNSELQSPHPTSSIITAQLMPIIGPDLPFLQVQAALEKRPFYPEPPMMAKNANSADSYLAFRSSYNNGITNSNSSFDGMAFDAVNSATNSSYAAAETKHVNEKFSSPVYFELNFEHKVHQRIYLGTGAGYLFMRSSYTEDFSNGYQNQVKTFRDFLVVPLYVKYNLVEKPSWRLFAALGGRYEFGLSGHNDIKNLYQGTIFEDHSEKYPYKSGQANVNLGLGGEYVFASHFSLSLSGTVSHYFYEKSASFWSQQAFWPGVKVGLVYGF